MYIQLIPLNAKVQNMRAERIFTNARLATMDPALPGLGVVENGMVAEAGGHILYAGPSRTMDTVEMIDCEGRWITPGLIDCHTHLIYAGDRAAEFESRLNGASYEEIARAGGGILGTMKATREASAATLRTEAQKRMAALIAEGVTTIEVKSGYGLSPESEYKCLEVAKSLGDVADISPTFLGAHGFPPELSRADYLRLLCTEMIPHVAAHNLADAVDGFCEGISFSPEEMSQVFTAATRHGLKVKLHADQLSDLRGAELAARFDALSADHLEYTSEDAAAAMAKSGTVAVLLPGAFFTLRETKLPPVAAFRKYNVPMAVSTDLNPGTSPLFSLLLAMNMAATQFRLTVEECLLGVTRHAAVALGRERVGVLKAGAKCHLAIWNIERPAELVYRIGFNPLHQRIWSAV